MPPSKDPQRRSPARRGDPTHPASARPGGRRGGDRRPYPTASTTTRVSPAKPGSASTRSRARGSAATPTPATVWTVGPAPIDLGTAWPQPIVSTIVSSFSKPGSRVALLPWPTEDGHARLAPVGADGVIDRAPATEPDHALADALAAVEGLDRTGRVVRVTADPTAIGPTARPFWADLVGDPDHSAVTINPPSSSGVGDGLFDGAEDTPADTDLIITSLRPEHGGNPTSDLVALVAARLLRVGGILAVLTHCDWPAGELIDPTGAVVASAQNADLLYLQHIVALHAPVRGGRFAAESLAEPGGPDAENEARTRHRAAVRGLPEPHRRIHSDVLVFAQPHDHEPPHLSPADAALESGVIR
ncbi:hypothetical protein [Kibdelosporangium phytohabitans]|uniref:Uncharacterized protein n=1 Tax=Kibdelosporangium phytohabitans TaxID=860235 RepID=A0A0N9HVF1_9PSEU|nr:hypothetical protein [Kibdelosporangium phytohabitans]ALG06937.1 hypothetical protein AOZ06_08360 [Kibdelosporangium phytohabitans]MBE1468206.1 hypothetical protein [Kibdelosporangium phytohabitans]